MKYIALPIFLFVSIIAYSQTNDISYAQYMKEFQENYVNTHEVVKGSDRKDIHFFPPDSTYQIIAKFQRIKDSVGFKMAASRSAQQYYRYGKVIFKIGRDTCTLYIYQSKDILPAAFKDYLFIPFTDATTGKETYEGGRYIDIMIPEIKDNKLLIDFNKAYNPYCCYVAGFNCPIPPKENELHISINAGEKKYTKPVH